MSKKYNNYKNYYNREEAVEPKTAAPVEVEEEVIEETVTVAPTIGVVYKCEKLNIRKRPTKESEVVAVVCADTEFEIIEIEKAADKDWYKVKTDTVIGFCMKDYIYVK